MEKGKGKINFSIVNLFYKIYFNPDYLKTLVLIGAEIAVMKNLIGEKEKCSNKGKDKLYKISES